MRNMKNECDVLVVGSGAGGLSAAITAGHAGADVIVTDAADKLGVQPHTPVARYGSG